MWIKDNFDIDSLFRDGPSQPRPELVAQKKETDTVRDRLLRFYAVHAPAKTVDDVNKIIAKYSATGGQGWFSGLAQKLFAKYGARP